MKIAASAALLFALASCSVPTTEAAPFLPYRNGDIVRAIEQTARPFILELGPTRNTVRVAFFRPGFFRVSSNAQGSTTARRVQLEFEGLDNDLEVRLSRDWEGVTVVKVDETGHAELQMFSDVIYYITGATRGMVSVAELKDGGTLSMWR